MVSTLVTAEDKLDNIVAKLFPYIHKVGPAHMLSSLFYTWKNFLAFKKFHLDINILKIEDLFQMVRKI